MQIEWFRRHLRLGKRTGLPVVVHCRDAAADLLPLLQEGSAAGLPAVLMHAFSGDAAMAAKCLELGLFLSFAGSATYANKKFASLRAAAAAVPADRIVIETDCPYSHARAFPRQAAERAGAGGAHGGVSGRAARRERRAVRRGDDGQRAAAVRKDEGATREVAGVTARATSARTRRGWSGRWHFWETEPAVSACATLAVSRCHAPDDQLQRIPLNRKRGASGDDGCRLP